MRGWFGGVLLLCAGSVVAEGPPGAQSAGASPAQGQAAGESAPVPVRQPLTIGKMVALRSLDRAAESTLNLPSDVAVGVKGRVYVVDGGNHRVVIYGAKGNFVAAVGGYGAGEGEFSEPLGVGLDRRGRVYVADTGNHRIQVLDRDGRFIRAIPLRDKNLPVRPVDVAVSERSGNLFVTCNNTHSVMKLSRKGKVLKVWGGEGTGRGQFRYPATLAVRQGKVAVVDVLNTRVQIFDEKGRFQYQVGEWGVLPGQLFRPKGIAFDREGRFYVSDSYMEVVQVFDTSYRVQHVLGTSGKPKRFSAPAGLAVDKANRLYVAEMLGKRVSVFQLR